nr:MAG TPA: hypothetical protein [Caudoviricetes sp.]
MARCLRQYRMWCLNYSAPPPESLVFTVFSILNLLFFSCNVYFSFLRKNIYFLKHALTPFTLSFRKQIFFPYFLFVFLWQCILLRKYICFRGDSESRARACPRK